MIRRISLRLVASAVAVGAMTTMSNPGAAAEPAEQAWAQGSPVQTYGVAPPSRMSGQAGAIQLVNDPQTGGDVYFLLDGREQSLKPGQSMNLEPRPHLVEFNTGGDAGDVRFTLYQGVYKFKVRPEGWGLFKSSSPSIAGQAPSQSRQGFSPPLPADDLRTRRMAGRTNENPAGRTDGNPSTGGRPVNPPLPPSASTGAGQDTTRSIAAPPPAGVTRERTTAPRTP
jgi:hypothetical protein